MVRFLLIMVNQPDNITFSCHGGLIVVKLCKLWSHDGSVHNDESWYAIVVINNDDGS